MNLIEVTRSVQRALPGVDVDGVIGMQTMLAMLHHLEADAGGTFTKVPDEQAVANLTEAVTALHTRTLACLATQDPKARERFQQFCELAQATAATLGCEYIMISGRRTWEEQSALYRAYQAGGPRAVPAGYSWHNYGTAGDFGVFQNGVYLDDGTNVQQKLADKVHRACAIHAPKCGLEAGAKWVGKSQDQPHYQINVGHSTPDAADRARFKEKGSVL